MCFINFVNLIDTLTVLESDFKRFKFTYSLQLDIFRTGLEMLKSDSIDYVKYVEYVRYVAAKNQLCVLLILLI